MKKNLLVTAICMMSFGAFAQKQYVYVGSATSEVPDPITLCTIDTNTGELKKVDSFEGTKSSSYLCVSKDNNFLYSVDSDNLDPSSKNHSVAAFKIDKKSKGLTLINKQSVEGRGACHVSATSDNKFLFAANYSSGNVVSLPLNKDGSIAPVASNQQHAGKGPNEKRQEGPHAHYVQSSPDNKYVFTVDLGIDKVMNYTLNQKTGELSPNPNQTYLKMPAGSGPRHMIIHPNEKFAYVLNELVSTISACKYDAKNGTFEIIETHPMLPADFTEFSKAAAIRIHPNGKYLYGSNRGHESMAVFEIKDSGNIDRIQIYQEGIAWPRDYDIEPSGKFMIVANRNESLIKTYQITDGKLKATKYSLEVAQPTSVVFVN
ncbi:MAG: lactonase family protein [Cyclobacteriaceae bacterium]